METQDDDHALRALFDQRHDAVFILDLEGNHLKANHRAAELLGYSEKEIQHLSYKDLSAEPFQSKRNLARLLHGEHIPLYERTFRRKDGTLLPVEINVELVRDPEGRPHHIQSVVRDISARKQAEAEREAALEALRESEARNRAILSAVPDLMFVLDHNGTYLDYHASDPDALYVPPETFLGETLQTTLPDETAATIQHAMDRVVKTGDVQRCEYQLPIRGRSRYFEARIVPYERDKVLSIVRDITEQRLTEEAYRALVEHSLQGLVILQDNSVAFANPAVTALTGYTTEELCALSPEALRSLLHPDDRAKVWDNMGKLLAGKPGQERQPFRFIRKDGEVRWVACSANPIEYQGRPAVQAMYIDITARKRAEQELQASEARFRNVFENAVMGIYRTTPAGKILMANPALVTMLGYESATQLLQRNLEAEGYEPDYPRAAFKARIEREGQVVGMESAWTRRDGRHIHVRENARAVRDPAGHTLYYEGTVEDITEHKQAEAEREAAFKALQQSQRWLEELAKRLMQAQEFERRALAREMHEDIAQVMLAVKLNLQSVLSDGLTPGTDDTIHTSMDALDNAIQRMQRLSRDLRPPVLDDLGLVPALRALVDRQARQASFQASFSSDRCEYALLPVVENAYFRIAQEAITNAARHAEATHVAVELRDEDGALLLVVRDDGTGFDAGARLNGGNAEESLGLISMRERAHLVGGSLTIDARPGYGTEIRVRTPIAPGGQTRKPGMTHPLRASGPHSLRGPDANIGDGPSPPSV